MLNNRGKHSKSETPTRQLLPAPRVQPTAKRSDPFLRQLREVYDKQNIPPNHPNHPARDKEHPKDNRVKSYTAKDSQARSPAKKIMYVRGRPNKLAKEELPSTKFVHSTELQRLAGNTKNSNRKSTEKDEMSGGFLEEYYAPREERREKKMKVTLKDIKKQRRSAQEEGHYLPKDEMQRESSSLRNQTNRNQSILADTLKNRQEMDHQENSHLNSTHINSTHLNLTHLNSTHMERSEVRCSNHPEKKATHRLLGLADNDDRKVFCEKCAVSLVTKGYSLAQLAENRLMTRQEERKAARVEQLKDFLFDLDRMEPVFRQVNGELSAYRTLLQNKYEEEATRLEDYFRSIRQEVERAEERSTLQLRVCFSAAQQEVERNLQGLQAGYEEVARIKEDILPNLDSIVQEREVAQPAFDDIIANYAGSLREVEQRLNTIAKHRTNFYIAHYERGCHFMQQAQEELTPIFIEQLAKPLPETGKKPVLDPEDKRLDPFRMSFGKQPQPSSFP